MRVSRIHRLLRLITLLQSDRGMTVTELADELQVSRRTVFRDLNMLELAHIPYYFDRERNGYRINRHFFLPPVNLDLTEALSVMLLAVRQGVPGGLGWSHHAHRAAMKLESALPDPVRRHIGDLLKGMDIHLAPSAGSGGADAFMEDIAVAIARRKACRLVYSSFYDRKQIRLTVHPLRLVFVHRAWYVLAWTKRFGEIRTFKLGRIDQLDVTDKTFMPPPEKAEEHFGQAWSMIPEGKCHNVHLRFDSQVAGNVAEVGWHDSQEVHWRDDGSMDFRVRVDGLGEITWWILGYGDKVRVVKPVALARKVQTIARQMVQLYDRKGE